jgi:hypothetical protein
MRGARGSEVTLPATRITQRGKSRIRFQGTRKEKTAGGLRLRLSPRNRQFRETTALFRGGQEQAFSLLDGRVHRRRQGLGVNGLIVVEAAAQHQGRGEDGQGQNRAHKTNSP